jgi:REP element-mobilizing transposase RayT
MSPRPIYSSERLDRAYHLRYTWSGWPSIGQFPPEPVGLFDAGLDAAWEEDGIRRLEHRWDASLLQFTFSVRPDVSPVFFTARVKGRLQHSLRQVGQPVRFSRKVAFRTIGDNLTADVEAYIERQVANARFADPRFQAAMQRLTLGFSNVRLSEPTETQRGQYWYNLHLVLVADQRMSTFDAASLEKLRDQTLRIAEKKGHAVSRLAVMPDHLHCSLRGNVEQSPDEIALSYLNNLAFAVGQKPIWQAGYYAGTFGEYSMAAVRERKDSQTPTRSPGG